MSYRTILLYGRSSAELTRLIAVLKLLLPAQSAVHVTGVYVIAVPAIYCDAHSFTDASLYQSHYDYHRQTAETMAAAFQDEITAIAASADFLVLNAGNSNGHALFSEAAMTTDLIITGPSDPEQPDTLIIPAEQIIDICQKPTLIVPAHFSPPQYISNLAIAFDGKQQACKAALDALPLACQAQSIHLIWIDAPENSDMSDAGPEDLGSSEADQQNVPQSLLRLQQAYQRHGLNPQIELRASEGKALEHCLRHFISEQAIDLLVMGAGSQSLFSAVRLRHSTAHALLGNLPCITLFSS